MQVTTLQPKKIWQKRIPTFIGLGFLVIALVIGVFFLGKGGGVFSPRATPETTPQNVKLTNVTDTTFTVSFLTDSPVKAYIKYGTDENDVALRSADDRDQLSGTTESYTGHHLTVRSLQPNTSYYYLIGTDEGGVFDNNGSVFKITTARKAGAAAAAKTIYGSVTAESGSPAAGAIVYLKIDGASEMSALVTNVGGWAVPLSNARTPDGSAYAQITNETTISINVQGAKAGQTAQTSVTVAQAQPVPTITFGKAVAQATAAPTPTVMPTETPVASSSGTVVMEPISTETGSASARRESSLDNLLSDTTTASASAAASESAKIADVTVVDVNDSVKTVVTTTQPTITGKVIPKVKVKIEVHSQTAINQEVTSDDNGNFQFDLAEASQDLEPGEHTVTYTYTDPKTGKDVTTTRTFTVAPKAKTLAAATTSPTATPFGSSNPYPIGGATSSATATTSASSTTSAKTTKSPASTRSSNPSTSSGMPVTGAIGTTLALVFGGLFFIIAGTWSFWISSQFAKEKRGN